MRRTGLLMTVLAITLASCASGWTKPPRANDVGYTGPPLDLKVVAGEHVVVLTAPTAGWTFSLDEIRPRMGGTNAFVTIRRPNPAYLVTQAQVEQNLGTGVSTAESIDVYARLLDYDDKGKSLNYYFAVGSD